MRTFLTKFFRRLLKRSSKSLEIDGLWVAADDEKKLAKLQDALRFIEFHDPRRYARLTRDLQGVWATLLTGPIGQFSYSDYICELDDRYVASASIEQMALVIVHEASHARLWRRGVRYSEDIRQRVEAICVRQEQFFVSRLPAPEITADQLAGSLDLPAEFWSEDAFYKRKMRGSVAALRHINMPHWLIGLVLRRQRSLRRRERRAKALAAQAKKAGDDPREIAPDDAGARVIS